MEESQRCGFTSRDLDKVPDSVLQLPRCPLLLSLLGDGKTVLVTAYWQQF